MYSSRTFASLEHTVSSKAFVVIALLLCSQTRAEDRKILKSSSDLLEKEAKRLTKDGLKCPLEKVSEKNIAHLRINEEYDKAIPCVIKFLTKTPNKGWQWSELGHMYNVLGKSTLANTCFKQAVKLVGKISDHVKQWHFIGPFVIGKMEVDGDPVAAFGGIEKVSKQRLKKGSRLYSELIDGAEIGWNVYSQTETLQRIQIVPKIQWNDLVSSLGSMAITEWQGWVVGEFFVNENNLNIIIQCLGVSTVYIDNIPVTGDVYHRDQFWFNVNLKQGIHTVYIRLRTKGSIQFQCTLNLAPSTFQILKPSFLPDLYDGYLFSGFITLPVMNMHSKKWLKNIKLSVIDQSEGEQLEIHQSEISSKVAIAPGQVAPIIFELMSENAKITDGCVNIDLEIEIGTSEGKTSHAFTLRCRKLGESFLFTFLDHDGSIQHAAAVPPIVGCENFKCPTLLTLHGTTVPPQNQADSYKRMMDGKYVFGSDHAWLLAPTRHGAHNWEGPGALTAMTSLDRLAQYTQSHDWIENKASNKHVIYAGHSMGGHGAWHLATHFADRALALVSLAGWIKKEEYGDSNLFFRHDVATTHVDPAIKSILEACIAENEADRHVSNIQAVPVLARIGAADRTVHPFFVRRMYRVLKEWGINVTYTELQGKEHWWWDTLEANDGGAVNDKQVRDFVAKYSIIPSTGSKVCQDDSCSDPNVCQDDSCRKKKASQKYTALANQGPEFTLTVMNPAFGEGVRGVRVIQQITPFRTSIVKGYISHDKVILQTTNVKRLLLYEPDLRPMDWTSKSIKIDSSSSFKFEDCSSSEMLVCNYQGLWSKCDDREAVGRLISQQGPARRIAEDKFIIVIGSLGNSSTNQLLQQFGVYIANLFFLTSDTIAPVMLDTKVTETLSENHNLIVIGGPEENSLTQGLLDQVPLKNVESKITLGSCSYTDPRTGALVLTPNGQDHLALVLMGNSLKGLSDVISLATPTIPPMTRSPFSNLIPDFIVTGSDFQSRGPGGYLCTGFWGNNWELRPELVSCVC